MKGLNDKEYRHFNLILEWPEVTSPGVSVAILFPLLAEVPGHIAIHNGLGQNHALQYTAR